MKFIKLSLKILLIITVIFFVALFGIRIYFKRAIPSYKKDVQLEGLTSKVEIYRDEFGIPHVYAENEKDLYTAVGYLLAQDRLWQMDLLRRVTLGRLSEIFGKKYADTDVLLRSLRYSKKSEELLKKTDEKIFLSLEAFAGGVNQYINTHQNKLPVEFTLLGYKPEPWQPLHSLNLIGYMAWDLKSGWSEFVLEDIRKVVDSVYFAELIPDGNIYSSYVFPEYNSDSKMRNNILSAAKNLENLGVDIFDGSNNWAVSGKKSVTGKPLLANDMHLGLNVPGIWYQMHQVVKGKLNVTGLLLPGQPLVICGHNDSIAWGMTNTYVDNVDFYMEKINPADSNQYLYLDEWKNFEVQNETIKTKEGDSIQRKIVFSHRGPVISEFKDIDDAVVTMHWIGDEPSNEMETIYLLNRAENWDKFKDAVKSFKSISQNIVYVDVNGNIGLYCSAGVPIRKRDILTGILPGWTDEYDWKGMIPFEELPFSYNPESGFVSSANNKTVDENYPYHISLWYSTPYRIDRIRELLSEKEKFSIDDFKNIQLDHKSKMVEMFLPLYITAIEKNKNLSALQEKCFNSLKSWDGILSKESYEATIFEYMYQQLLKEIFMDELGNTLFDEFKSVGNIGRIALYRMWKTGNSVWIDNIVTQKKETKDDIILESFKNTISALEKKYGPDTEKWKWGDVHQLTFSHPLSAVKMLNAVFKLNRGPFATGGSSHTVSPYSYPNNDFGVVNHGASHRHIYSVGNWDESLTVIPTGNSGIPLSRNYCDQSEMYINGEYHADIFSKEKVESEKKYYMVFTPKK